MEGAGVNSVLVSFVRDGIFGGVGTVLSFLPIIITLFFFLSLLEDSGYMARVAFVMDKLLRKIGLSGRSIVPHAHRLRLQRARHHGQPHPAKRARPQNDHPAHTIYELQRQSARLRDFSPPPSSQITAASS